MMETTKIKDIKIDYISFAFMAIGIGCLEFLIDNGNSNDWFGSIKIIILLAISIISLIFFIWRGIIFSSVVKIRILSNVNFSICCILCFIFVALFSASMAYFPTMLQQIYNYPVELAGYITAPRGIAAVIGAALTQSIIVKKIGARGTVSLGLLVFGTACLIQANFSINSNEFDIILSAALQGFGMMMFFVPFMSMLVVGMNDKDMGDMSGIFNFFRNFGGSIGTALVATFISRNQQTTYQELSKNISSINSNFQSWSQSIDVNTNLAINIANEQIISQSSLLSYLNSFYIVGIISILLAVTPFILKEPH